MRERGFTRQTLRGPLSAGLLQAGESRHDLTNYSLDVRLFPWIDAANLYSFGHAADAEDVGGDAHGHIPVQMDFEHVAEGRLHHPLQAVVNVLRLPEKVLLILDPLEVRDCDTAGAESSDTRLRQMDCVHCRRMLALVDRKQPLPVGP